MLKTFRTGKPIDLRQELASSGQGTVYLTDQPAVLAKIYNTHEDAERADKLRVMVFNPPEDPSWVQLQHHSIAWPMDLLMDAERRCVGFIMPHLQNARELTHVYNPAFRQRYAPKFNWYYLHSAALNYVSAVEAIHAKGYVIGDIKPQNILVNPQALISVIDTDSFQIADPQSGTKYRCPVGTEGFTPHELLTQLRGRPFNTIDRTEMHDRFGVAVIIYLLLFGRHPFMEGRWKREGDPPSPDERVLRGLWLHNPGSEIAMDPGTIPLDVVHPILEQCFRRCFTDGHMDPSLRPSANEWRRVLRLAIEDLDRCSREKNHWYSRSRSECVWCARRSLLGYDVFNPNPRDLRAERDAKEAKEREEEGAPVKKSVGKLTAARNKSNARANSRKKGAAPPEIKVTRTSAPPPSSAHPVNDEPRAAGQSALWDAVTRMFGKKKSKD